MQVVAAARPKSAWWTAAVPLLFPQPALKCGPNQLLFHRLSQFLLHGIAWFLNEDEVFFEGDGSRLTLRLSCTPEKRYQVTLSARLSALPQKQLRVSKELIEHAFEDAVKCETKAGGWCHLTLFKDVTHQLGNAEAAENLARCLSYVRVLWLTGPLFAEIKETTYAQSPSAPTIVAVRPAVFHPSRLLWLHAERSRATLVVADPTSAMPHDVHSLVHETLSKIRNNLQKRKASTRAVSITISTSAPSVYKEWAKSAANKLPTCGIFVTLVYQKDSNLHDTQLLQMAKFALGVSSFFALISLRNRLRLRWQSLDLVCSLQHLATKGQLPIQL